MSVSMQLQNSENGKSCLPGFPDSLGTLMAIECKNVGINQFLVSCFLCFKFLLLLCLFLPSPSASSEPAFLKSSQNFVCHVFCEIRQQRFVV